MNRFYLALAGVVCAPFLYIDLQYNGGRSNWISGLNGLILMFGWMCSMAAIYMSGILGSGGRRLIMVQLGFLLPAEAYHIDLLVMGDPSSFVQRYLDPFWPLSHLLLFVLSIVILRAAKAPLRSRLLPLVTGTWFPMLFALMQLAPERVAPVAGLYSAVGWVALGIFAMTVKRTAIIVKMAPGDALSTAGRHPLRGVALAAK